MQSNMCVTVYNGNGGNMLKTMTKLTQVFATRWKICKIEEITSVYSSLHNYAASLPCSIKSENSEKIFQKCRSKPILKLRRTKFAFFAHHKLERLRMTKENLLLHK